MMESYFSVPVNKLTVIFSKDDARAQTEGVNREFYYDLNFNTAKGTFGYINKKGVAVAERDIATIAHELGHAMKGLDDNWESFNNYSGENVTYVNQVLVELGIDEVLSYPGSWYSDIIDIGRDYAKGQAINRAYTHILMIVN